MAAYRLPKATDEEKAARTRRFNGAARRHRDPARTLRACADALVTARVVADYGNRSRAKRRRRGDWLLKAAPRRRRNVRINLRGIEGRGFKSATEAETRAST
jgi:formiminotetrahydrofolate cyclodeaminase